MDKYLLLFKLVSNAMKIANSPELAHMHERAKAVIAAVTPDLPKKADGSAWTQEDVDRIADSAEHGFLAALARELARKATISA